MAQYNKGVAHDHSMHPHHHHIHSPMHNATKNVRIAFLLNLCFTVFEIFGAFWTGSVAIWADVMHDLGDSMTLGMALILQKISEKEATAEYTYGYARFSVLSALLAGIILCVGSVGIFYTAIQRFFHPYSPHTGGMMILAAVGVVINGIAFFRLRGGHTQNEKILSWHLFEDFAGWIGVLVGALLIRWTGAVWIDPLLACLLAVVILWNAFKNLRGTVGLLLQRSPANFDEKKFIADVRKVPGVCDVHDLHVWSLDGEFAIMSFHLVLDSALNKVEEVSSIKLRVRECAKQYGSFHTTIEIEHTTEPCVLRDES